MQNEYKKKKHWWTKNGGARKYRYIQVWLGEENLTWYSLLKHILLLSGDNTTKAKRYYLNKLIAVNRLVLDHMPI